jgi:hypothetical protein
MKAHSAVEALKALHLKTVWSNSGDWDGYYYTNGWTREGCILCGDRSINTTYWPCQTRAILDQVEKEGEQARIVYHEEGE